MKNINSIIVVGKVKATARFTALLLAGIMLLDAVSFAAFKDSGWGVRPLGMGGAFTAVANDASAPVFNAAGLGQIQQPEISFMSAKLFTGLEGVDLGLNYFGYVAPVNDKIGSLGVSWTSLSSPGLYREDTGNISYGQNFDGILGIANMNFMFGANLKYLRQEYDLDDRTKDDPVFSKGNKSSAVTGDAGMLFNWPKIGLSLGLSSKNLTSPDMGLKTTDKIPNENVAGLAYYNEKLPGIRLPYFTVAVDYVSRDKDSDIRAGMETWLFNGKFAVRGGGSAQQLTLGLGYEVKLFSSETKLILDYALAWPLEVEKTTGSHRLGLSLRLP